MIEIIVLCAEVSGCKGSDFVLTKHHIDFGTQIIYWSTVETRIMTIVCLSVPRPVTLHNAAIVNDGMKMLMNGSLTDIYDSKFVISLMDLVPAYLSYFECFNI